MAIEALRTATAEAPASSGVAAQQRRRMDPAALTPFIGKGGAKGELADRLYKQATDKIIGVSEEAVRVLERCL